MLCFSSLAQARDYVENQDYKVVSQNKTVSPEIREFFSFFCSHCYSMSGFFDKLKADFASKAKFVPNPVGIIGGPIGVETQKAYAVAQKMGLEDVLKQELFDRIHLKQQKVESHSFFVDLFNSIGVPEEKYEQDYSSFVIQAKVAEYDRYMAEYDIQAVPEVVINGKYLLISDNIESEDEYEKLVDYLLTLP